MATMSSTIQHVIKRTGETVPFETERIFIAVMRAAESVRGSDEALAKELTQAVVANLETSFTDVLPNIEEIQDVIDYTLRQNGHIKTADAFLVYRAGREKIRRGDLSENLFAPDGVPRKKINDIWKWNVIHECDTIPNLNKWVTGGHFSELVQLAIAEYEKDLDLAVEKIAKQAPRIIIVAGPSSSGKTTTTVKVGRRLEHCDKRLVTLNLDNYFRGLSEYPVDEFGDRDFETPHALSLDLINEHLRALIKGETVLTPRYDFKRGIRLPDDTELSLKKNEILILDSLHGLYPAMTDGISDRDAFRIFIGTFNVLKDTQGNFTRWTDIRLLRRMLRDNVHRNHGFAETIGHWHYVRNSELRHIIPFIGAVNHIVNGGLAFELPILKHHMYEQFPIPTNVPGIEKKLDARLRIERIRKLFDSIEAFSDPSVVPKDCHLREFIGGSSIDVHS